MKANTSLPELLQLGARKALMASDGKRDHSILEVIQVHTEAWTDFASTLFTEVFSASSFACLHHLPFCIYVAFIF